MKFGNGRVVPLDLDDYVIALNSYIDNFQNETKVSLEPMKIATMK